MKKFFNVSLLAALIVLLQSCDSTDAYFGKDADAVDTVDPLPGSFTLNDLINVDNIATDTLYFNNDKDTVLITGNGMRITLPQNCVQPSNDSDSLLLLIKEFPTLKEMFYGNIQTVSNQEHLATGGNFWWNIVNKNGTSLSFNNPSQVRIDMPIKIDMGNYMNSAQLFYGNWMDTPNQNQVINWNLSNTTENTEAQSMVIENYFVVNNIELGWVNCDAFANVAGNKTQFTASLQGLENPSSAEMMLFLFPKSYPSIINIYNQTDTMFGTYDNSIPENLEGTLLGLAIDENESLWIGTLDITVQGDDNFNITLLESTPQDLENIINQLSL